MSSVLEQELLCDWIWGRICGIEELILDTQYSGKEHARTICSPVEDPDAGTFYLTPPCVGEKCHVTPPRCPTEERAVGTIHTHPQGHVEFSSGDYLSSIKNREKIQCLATSRKHIATSWNASSSRVPTIFDIYKNMIKCEKLNMDMLDKNLVSLLAEANELAKDIADKALEGKPYDAETKYYREKMGEFRKGAKDSGFVIGCAVPEFMGVWERPTIRKEVKE